MNLIAEREKLLKSAPQPLADLLRSLHSISPFSLCTTHSCVVVVVLNRRNENVKTTSDLEFRPLTVEGVFDYGRQFAYGPRSAPPTYAESRRGGLPLSTGYYLITPFRLADG